LRRTTTIAEDLVMGLQDKVKLVTGEKLHNTPLFVTSERERGPSSIIPGLITTIPMKIDKSSTHSQWVKRGLALLCQPE